MLFRGKPGSTISFTVLRVQQSAEPQEFELTRERVEPPDVESQVINGDIGLIRVASLEKGKAEKVARHVKQVTNQGARQLVLDLRRAATGDPEEGVALADLFLNDGLITYLEGQRVTKQEFRATSDATATDLPMAVLINRGTARGAEIAAAALLDNERGQVVGERSYGDAALRRAVRLEDGGAVILSVAKYHSPKGEAIQDTGVTPSVVAIAREPIPEEDEDNPTIRPVPEPSIDEDTILQKAIEVLDNGATEVAQDSAAHGDEEVLSPLGVPQKPGPLH
jgi:carboxyl-terminal processing protease